MHLQLIFHLPGVTFAAGGGSALGPGRVEHLSFSDWQALDPSFALAGTKYERASPVFWIGNADVDDDTGQDQIIGLLHEVARRIHCAFLLEPRVPHLPTPALSVKYVRVAGHPDSPGGALGTIMRVIGPAEREWVVFGSPVSVPYDAATLAQVARELVWIAALDPAAAPERVRAGLATLERTARPDTWWGSDEYLQSVNDFVHCAAACEGLLLAGEARGDTLTDTFGRNAAAVTTRARGDLSRASETWADLYRLRSRLVHGQLGLRNLDLGQRERLADARRLLRVVIKAVIALRLPADPRAGERLPSLLARAYRDPAAHAALHDRLNGAP